MNRVLYSPLSEPGIEGSYLVGARHSGVHVPRTASLGEVVATEIVVDRKDREADVDKVPVKGLDFRLSSGYHPTNDHPAAQG